MGEVEGEEEVDGEGYGKGEQKGMGGKDKMCSGQCRDCVTVTADTESYSSHLIPSPTPKHLTSPHLVYVK